MSTTQQKPYNTSLSYKCNERPETIPDERNMYSYMHANSFRTQIYSNYDDIKGGYIRYFKKERPVEQLYQTPVFVNDLVIQSKIYIDPMGSVKQEYNVCKIRDNKILKDQPVWMKDTLEWREELIAKQMKKYTQIEYTPQWNTL